MTFELYHKLSECTDSMLFDCYERIATFGTDDNYVALDVYWDVSVLYEDESYNRASEMPEELLDRFRTGTAYNDDKLEIRMNNWFAYVHVLNGNIDPDDIVCESDISVLSESELQEDMKEVWEYFNR